jgi:hypothetical protein
MADRQKITSALDSQLRQVRDELLDVVVELSPDTTEAATAPELRDSFEKAVAPVSEAISRSGGEVVDSAWLNRTLRVKIPAAEVPELSDMREIAALDVPHQVSRG